MKGFVFCMLAIGLFNYTSAWAQDDKASLSEQEQKAIENVMKAFNQKLEVALLKQDKYPQMKNELEKMKMLKTAKERSAAVEKYQNTYRSVMDEAMTLAQLSRSGLQQALEAAAPRYTFKFSANYTIEMILRATRGNLALSVWQPPPQVTVINLGKFERILSYDGYIAGHQEITYTDNSAKLKAMSVGAGMYKTMVIYQKKYAVPVNVRKATLHVKAKLKGDAYALCIGGSVSSVSSGYCSIGSKGEASRINLLFKDIYASHLLVFAWVGYEDAELELDERIDLPLGKEVEIKFNTSASATVALSSYAEANTSISEISAEVYLEN
ncbi:hypothetical protein P1X15_04465 [Runella sp. MFBS21]|uniref:hypothetical protein n=1 Tax=Runella sp. MFBS21 TaxID=3034018 RepID=UPI0023F8EE99|nr:hypothetical protein [Runella sp. MFBS21]MDF7816833.1 hypothetical protein [Runella sp. MFBS21]